MDLQTAIQQTLTAPSPDALWDLYGYLLAVGAEPPLLETVAAFHHYLCDLQSKATARQYSEFASLLDIGAVGGVAAQNLIGAFGNREKDGGRELLEKLLLGTGSESLMVAASRQYIKAWQAELYSVHCQSAWFLAGALWQLAAAGGAGREAVGERWARIQALFAPIRDPDVPNAEKALLLARTFQLVLVSRLITLVQAGGRPAP
ncbi:MAG: hypothetical protein JXR83_20375 [Deltaproteobacteria bacterium]|nr:hypothetical protein [Deltaproteobacteria bacterium]